MCIGVVDRIVTFKVAGSLCLYHIGNPMVKVDSYLKVVNCENCLHNLIEAVCSP